MNKLKEQQELIKLYDINPSYYLNPTTKYKYSHEMLEEIFHIIYNYKQFGYDKKWAIKEINLIIIES